MALSTGTSSHDATGDGETFEGLRPSAVSGMAFLQGLAETALTLCRALLLASASWKVISRPTERAKCASIGGRAHSIIARTDPDRAEVYIAQEGVGFGAAPFSFCSLNLDGTRARSRP